MAANPPDVTRVTVQNSPGSLTQNETAWALSECAPHTSRADGGMERIRWSPDTPRPRRCGDQAPQRLRITRVPRSLLDRHR